MDPPKAGLSFHIIDNGNIMIDNIMICSAQKQNVIYTPTPPIIVFAFYGAVVIK